MGIETQIGWMIISILTTAITFYGLGHTTGKRDGAKLGRSVGIRIGERREIERRDRVQNG
jgi:hypothetical protein